MYSKQDLKKKTSLSDDDISEIRKCRRSHNRFGFAYQLGFVRLLNRLPQQRPFEVIDELATFTGVQLQAESSLLNQYRRRQQTVSEHQLRIVAHLGLRSLGNDETRVLEAFVFQEAWRLEQAVALEARAKRFLEEHGILAPADYRVSRIVGEQRKLARSEMFQRIATAPHVPVSMLEKLLVVPEGDVVSTLQEIKANPNKPSARAMLTLLRKLRAIEETGVLAVDLSWLSGNYQRALFHQVRKSSVHRLKQLSSSRLHAALVCFLWQSYRDAIDQAVDMFDKIMTRTNTRAKNELTEQLGHQRKSMQGFMKALKEIGNVVLDDDISDSDIRPTIFGKLAREEIAEHLAGVEEWVAGKKSHPFYGVMKRYSILDYWFPKNRHPLDDLCRHSRQQTMLRPSLLQACPWKPPSACYVA
jgi:hypothetical protein